MSHSQHFLHDQTFVYNFEIQGSSKFVILQESFINICFWVISNTVLTKTVTQSVYFYNQHSCNLFTQLSSSVRIICFVQCKIVHYSIIHNIYQLCCLVCFTACLALIFVLTFISMHHIEVSFRHNFLFFLPFLYL